MSAILYAIYFLAGAYVLAETLNHLERTDIFDGRTGWLCRLSGFRCLLTPWRWTRAKMLVALDLVTWAVLSVGAWHAFITPLMHLHKPTLQDVALIAGTALLLVSARLRKSYGQATKS